MNERQCFLDPFEESTSMITFHWEKNVKQHYMLFLEMDQTSDHLHRNSTVCAVRLNPLAIKILQFHLMHKRQKVKMVVNTDGATDSKSDLEDEDDKQKPSNVEEVVGNN